MSRVCSRRYDSCSRNARNAASSGCPQPIQNGWPAGSAQTWWPIRERHCCECSPARERALPQRPSGRSPLGVGHGIVDPLRKNGVISHGVHVDANPAWTHGFAAHLSRLCAVSSEKPIELIRYAAK